MRSPTGNSPTDASTAGRRHCVPTDLADAASQRTRPPRRLLDGSVPPQPERQDTWSKKEVKHPSSIGHCGLG